MPSPRPGEVLVRVHAAAITRGELEWPVDRLPAIPSYELSGVLVDSGDEVYALTPFDRDGVAAEYALVPARVLAPKPARLSHVEAAALPMGGLTAWQALFVHGRLARGERVLVTGASGGVGHVAVQLARHAGAEVVESGPVDLVFDTRGGEIPAGGRVVTIVDGGAGRDLLRCRTRPRATAGVGCAGGRGRASPGSRLGLPAHRGAGGLRTGCGPRQAGQGRTRSWQWLAEELPPLHRVRRAQDDLAVCLAGTASDQAGACLLAGRFRSRRRPPRDILLEPRRVRHEFPYFLRAAAGDGDLGSPLERLLA